MESLSNKTLVMIVGPTAVGKSTLMHEVARLDSRFGYVRSFTTRPERDGEASTYRHMSEHAATRLYDEGKTVTFFRHPTTQVIYGTTAESYGHEFNLLDTLSGSVELYRSLPFERTITISLTTDPDEWLEWIQNRFPNPSEERTKRLREAIASIEWSLSQAGDHYWVVNQPNDLQKSARRIIDIVSGRSIDGTPQPPEAAKLRERAKSLLSYE